MLSANHRRTWLARIKKVCAFRRTKRQRKPSALFDETNPDWAPSLQLGYGSKHTAAVWHEHDEERHYDKRQAEFERRRRHADAVIVDTAAEPASQTCAAADASASPLPVHRLTEKETMLHYEPSSPGKSSMTYVNEFISTHFHLYPSFSLCHLKFHRAFMLLNKIKASVPVDESQCGSLSMTIHMQ
ncbi:hypothetical protein HPB51_019979 [Rhipicephalus microplus]|uniref:Uncharacterized protein n=1 Tax=Rhipicephalus microplus TaxID=6941 RepID=A0A9J6DBW8_RHIMP|nr:hypothetical protein HPB51_019979 [Rhipicephalus microplus]